LLLDPATITSRRLGVCAYLPQSLLPSATPTAARLSSPLKPCGLALRECCVAISGVRLGRLDEIAAARARREVGSAQLDAVDGGGHHLVDGVQDLRPNLRVPLQVVIDRGLAKG